MKLDLKQARAIARQVGATIEETFDNPNLALCYIVRLAVHSISDSGARETVEIQCPTPEKAAQVAIVETARYCRELADLAKRVYAESDLIFVK